MVTSDGWPHHDRAQPARSSDSSGTGVLTGWHRPSSFSSLGLLRSGHSSPGSRPSPLTATSVPTPSSTPVSTFVPSWSSDGQRIYYSAFNLERISTGFRRSCRTGLLLTAELLRRDPRSRQVRLYIVDGVAAPDTTAPSAPTSLRVSLNGAHPVVSWKWPTDVDVSKVIVRRLAGTVAPATPTDGSPVYTGRALTTTDAVTAGDTYTYAAWAVDGAGNTSGPSGRQDLPRACGRRSSSHPRWSRRSACA